MQNTLDSAFIKDLAQSEFRYPVLIFFLFIIPRFFSRYKIPTAISALFLGVLSNILFQAFLDDATVKLFASLGIIALFLFAGLEVRFNEILAHRKILFQHIALRVLFLSAVTCVAFWLFPIPMQAACLLALAFLTPSTGFILETLDYSSLPEERKFWIKSKAIASEIIALAVMFFAIKMDNVKNLAQSSIILALMIFALPIIFRTFAKRVIPYAPQSEFGFLLMVALIFGVITKKLGAYYLVGAFLVGIVGRRFEESVPNFTSKKMLHSVKVFASFFTPFYFFQAGLGINAEDITGYSILLGIGLTCAINPLRIIIILIHRRYSMNEKIHESLPVATSLLPTLVFGLVLANVLRDVFQIPPYLFGALIVYTLCSTLLPQIINRIFMPDSRAQLVLKLIHEKHRVR